MSDWFQILHLAGYRIEGPDAADFFQSQFTSDARKLERDCWKPTAWCNRKGRTRLISLAKGDEQRVELALPRAQIGLVRSLVPYTIGRKVTITSALLVFGTYDGTEGGSIAGDEFKRRMRLGPDPGSKAPPAQGDDSHEASDLLRWRTGDILTPLPWLDEHSQDRFLPQALGLEENEGLSYGKGCYPGQEIVARVHYLGRSPEKLVGLRFNASDELKISDLSKASAQTADGQRVALLSAAPDGDIWRALAVAPQTSSSDAPVQIETPRGPIEAEMTAP